MWRLTFPFFAIKLGAAFVLTLAHALVFRFTVHKLSVTNIILTFIAIALAITWHLLPSASQPVAASLGVSVNALTAITPQYLTVETSQIETLLREYEYFALQQPFVPQSRYVNLAILAYAAHHYEIAHQFVNLARSIDPNQDFFSD